eukprot:m.6858 g.6858  ORF g.6858 m.6858 type:complete len:59 (-) comp5576_c1_seq1:60-236(-)
MDLKSHLPYTFSFLLLLFVIFILILGPVVFVVIFFSDCFSIFHHTPLRRIVIVRPNNG